MINNENNLCNVLQVVIRRRWIATWTTSAKSLSWQHYAPEEDQKSTRVLLDLMGIWTCSMFLNSSLLEYMMTTLILSTTLASHWWWKTDNWRFVKLLSFDLCWPLFLCIWSDWESPPPVDLCILHKQTAINPVSYAEVILSGRKRCSTSQNWTMYGKATCDDDLL